MEVLLYSYDMCFSPLIIRRKVSRFSQGVMQPVPCGSCDDCRISKIKEWSFRIRKEAEVSTSAFFITLTYSEKDVPINDKGYRTLLKKDVQDFMKRLRHYEKGNKIIKYYFVGEYGTRRTKRPHYHAIIFNVVDSNNFFKAWTKGIIDVSEIDLTKEATKPVGYVIKYISKPRTKDLVRQREFSLMSKGLGANYLTDNMIEYHNRTLENCYLTTRDGFKTSLPKYYKDKIYDESTRSRLTTYLHNRAVDKYQQDITYIQGIANTEEDVKYMLNNLDNYGRSSNIELYKRRHSVL